VTIFDGYEDAQRIRLTGNNRARSVACSEAAERCSAAMADGTGSETPEPASLRAHSRRPPRPIHHRAATVPVVVLAVVMVPRPIANVIVIAARHKREIFDRAFSGRVFATPSLTKHVFRNFSA